MPHFKEVIVKEVLTINKGKFYLKQIKHKLGYKKSFFINFYQTKIYAYIVIVINILRNITNKII